MCRVKNPEEMIALLEDCIATLRSDKWMDTWWRINDASENLLNNNQLDVSADDVIDKEAWVKDIINDGVELVGKKKDTPN